MNDFVFNSYHDNGAYADLSIYGRRELIITNAGKEIYNCGDYIKRFGYSDLITMKKNGIRNYDQYIWVNPIKEADINVKILDKNTIYNNFFLAPWAQVFIDSFKEKTKTPDIAWYKLNEYPRFSNIQGVYYGTNYGTIWSVLDGKYLSNVNKKKDGTTPIVYNIYEVGSAKFQTLANEVTSYFVKNPKKYEHLYYIDGNIYNNHVSNIGWCASASDAKVKELTGSKNTILSKAVVDSIIADINSRSFIHKDDIYREWSKKLNTTIRNILNSLNNYYTKDELVNLTNPNMKNKVEISTTPLIINSCAFIEDYNPTYEYVVLKSFGKPTHIVTKDKCLYKCCTKNMANMYFPEDKNMWVDRAALDFLPNMSKSSIEIDKRSVDSIKCDYIPDHSSINAKTVYNLYFGNSPWWRKISGEDINFCKMNSHSKYDVYDFYFVCDDGLIYSVPSSLYMAPKIKDNAGNVYSNYVDITGKTNTRSAKVLINSFGFKELSNEQIIERIRRVIPNFGNK